MIYHFNLKYDIKMKIDVFNYSMIRIFNQLTLNNINEQDSVVFFLKNMILIEIQYIIHNKHLFPVIKTLKF